MEEIIAFSEVAAICLDRHDPPPLISRFKSLSCNCFANYLLTSMNSLAMNNDNHWEIHGGGIQITMIYPGKGEGFDHTPTF